jgi:enoyl-CoA hydratase/carnithine racemase
MLRKKARGFESAKNFNCASARQQAVLVDKAPAALLQSGTFHAKEIVMAEPVLMEKEADVTTITLNRPESGNRQTDATWAKVTEMFDAASKQSRVILFKGAGDDFCLGREAMGQQPPNPLEAYAVRDRSETIFNLYGAFRNARAPIIGVVQGRAVGLGCALAALCDITIASDKARFSFPETAHRIMPTIAFSALVDRVPRKAATFMMYSAQEIDAHKALIFGLASDVVAANDLDSAVTTLLEHLKKMPLAAVLALKEYARVAFGMSTQGATDFARNLHATVNSFSGMRS